MDKFIVTGGNPLKGTIRVSGAKNVALKALVAACLTDEEVKINNIPHISDFFEMVAIMKDLGARITMHDHSISVKMEKFASSEISLDQTAKSRTSAMFIAPLLVRTGKAIIPNPSGCRLGARPIDRIIEGLNHMHAKVVYKSEDGYFHAQTDDLRGTTYRFRKNSHTGTETMILASVLAKGTTVLQNAAEEPEIDELIDLLNAMGAKITRSAHREITIDGVSKLHGATCTIKPDRNEIITFAIAALVTKGDVFIIDANKVDIDAFLDMVKKTGAGFEKKENGIRFFANGHLDAIHVTTSIYPGFMTDWQAPWAVLMTQAKGISTIHETVFENKLGYVYDLRKMGARIDFFNPTVADPEKTYNFNLDDDDPSYVHAIRIHGPTKLHDAITTMIDLRAGAAIVLAALAAKGTSTIFGIDKLDRGYEQFDERLQSLGAQIKRVKEK